MQKFILLLLIISSSIINAQITVNSNFEGGNGIATFINAANNEVHIASELKGGDTKNIVYYTQISGLNPAMQLTLQVSATWRGHEVVYSYDNINWVRSTKTNLDNFKIPLTSDMVYVAHSYPHTYSNMIADVNTISTLPFVTATNLAISEGGRRVKLVRISDNCEPDAGKELIWIFGRMHAFENPGSLSVQGMINYFVSDNPTAKRLRKEAIIYVVPMMDVDMAFNGGSGKDQTPVDFNRDWGTITGPSNWNAVIAAKALMNSTAAQNNFSVFFDSHSPPTSHGTSMFYYMYYAPHHLSNIRFVNDVVQEIGGYKGEEEVYSGVYNAVSQDYALLNYDNPKHYNVTMETGFRKRPDGVDWTKALYYKNGEDHAEAISEYIHGLAKSNDILIDNTNTSQVTLTGNWLTQNTIFGFLGANYISAEPATPSSATFSTTTATAGKYEIFTRWVSSPTFANNAAASFTYSGGSVPFTLNMTSKGGNWVSLGTYDLNAAEQISLTISNANSNKTIVADGFRISKVVDCAALSTSEIVPQKNDLELYPNPATSEVNLKISEGTKLIEMKIYNTAGQLILTSTKTKININALNKGIYFVDVLTDKERIRKKLIKE